MVDVPIAFLSYVWKDDQHENGQLTELRERITGEVRLQSGREFRVFQDRTDIAWGEHWAERIDGALDTSALLIPVITPGFFASSACRAELSRFLRREQELGRDDLIFPLYYVDTPILRDPAERRDDPLVAAVNARQYYDVRHLRGRPARSAGVRTAVQKLGARITEFLAAAPTTRTSPTQPVGDWRSQVLLARSRLIHADTVIDRLSEAIADVARGSAITVSGAGGLGKTAVTYEAVERVVAAGVFTHVVWASAKNVRFSGSTADGASVGSMYWHDLIAVIAAQLDCPPAATPSLAERSLAEHVRAMAGARILVVVDNLEVVRAAENVLQRLGELGLRSPHTVVTTTRWAQPDDALDIDDFGIRPFTAGQTYELVRLVTADTGSDLAEAPDGALEPIFAITEGNPFLIKLIAHRYIVSGQSIDRIIAELATGSGSRLGGRVRAWLFDLSLDELRARTSEDDALGLLFSFCATGRGGALGYAELRADSAVADDRFDDALDLACRLELVRPSDGNRRYSIHSLLYEYTCPLAWAGAPGG